MASDQVRFFLPVAFAWHANKDGLAWPGLKAIKGITGLGNNSIKSARAELVKCGLLRKIKESGGRGKIKVKYQLSSEILPGSEAFTQAPQSIQRKDFRRHEFTPSIISPSDKPCLRTRIKKSTSMSIFNENKPKSENQASEHPSRTDDDAGNFKIPRSDGKTLAEVLGIDTNRLRNRERRGMRDFQLAFEKDRPALEREGLAAWLDARLRWMTAEGHVYPKVVLRRLKQLQRSRTTAAVEEAPETPDNFQDDEPGELDKLRELRDALRSGLWAFWEVWTRPARAGTHAQKCRAFLEAADSKGVELTREEREVLECHANGMAKESPHDKK